MSHTIAVCDDEKTMLSQLSDYLKQIETETGDELKIFLYSSAEEVLEYMDRNTQLLLLDISMGEMTGMDCAKKLRSEGYAGSIIFITSMEEYAKRGYKVHAFDFISKPVTYPELKNSLLECFAEQDKDKAPVLPVETSKGVRILNINDIIYAEVYQHRTSFSLEGGKTVDSLVQLSEIEEKLSGQGFFRCHRSYLVNMRHVSHITATELTMSNGFAVLLSKYRSKEFMIAYARFMRVHL